VRFPQVRIVILGVAALTMIAVSACSGSEDGDVDATESGDIVGEAVFDTQDADAAAHAALPAATDLPGTGWEVTARDEFDDDDDEFDRYLEEEPACRQFAEMDDLPGFLGGGDDEDEPLGRAQVEYSRVFDPDEFPDTVEVEVEVFESVADVQAGWGFTKDLFESEEMAECFEAAFARSFEDDPEMEGFEIELDVRPRDSLAESPRGGAAIGFDLSMEFVGFEFEVRMEIHFWPHGNAEITTGVSGTRDRMTRSHAAEVLAAVDAAVARSTE
jgi:hypothetical protein